MEVIYTGLHQTPVQIVEAAVQEDVDVIALSVLSGAHMTLFPEVLRLMRDRGVGDRLLTGGGIIPNEDMATLARDGVGRLFGPGTNTQDIVAYIREWYAGVHGADALPPLPPPPASPHPMVAAGERPAPAAARDRHHAKPAVRAARQPAAKPAKRSAAARKARKASPARAGAAATRGTASGAKRAGARGKPATKRPRAKGRPGARKKSARG
jgi:methylmalonyl-CoA mutase C-terminal domain/subunit